MAEVARLYYVRELTQQQIAERLGVSRFKVLRLLEQARTEGVVRFEIDEPVPVLDELSRGLEERYGITAVVVAHDVSGAAASSSPACSTTGDVLGVAWGRRSPRSRPASPSLAPSCRSSRSAARSRASCRAPGRPSSPRASPPGRVGASTPSRRRPSPTSGAPARRSSDHVGLRRRVGCAARHRDATRRRRAPARPRLRRRRPHRLRRARDRALGAATQEGAGGRRRGRSPQAARRPRCAADGADRRAGHRRRVRPARAPDEDRRRDGLGRRDRVRDGGCVRRRGLRRPRRRPGRPVPGARTARRARVRARDQRPPARRRAVDAAPKPAWDAVLEPEPEERVPLLPKRAIPLLRANRGGAIVTLSSVLGLVGGDADFATHAYAASKAGLIGLTRAMAVTYARDGIRCNVVAPGLIETPMSARAQERPGDPRAAGRPAAADRRLRLARRRRRPPVVYLATAPFVTGAVLTRRRRLDRAMRCTRPRPRRHEHQARPARGRTRLSSAARRAHALRGRRPRRPSCDRLAELGSVGRAESTRSGSRCPACSTTRATPSSCPTSTASGRAYRCASRSRSSSARRFASSTTGTRSHWRSRCSARAVAPRT